MWKIGQKLICKKKTSWVWDVSNSLANTSVPKFGEKVTFDGYKSSNHIFLEEYDYLAPSGQRIGFLKDNFVPIQYQSISSELASSFNETQEKSDLPIRELETKSK